jgi:hypothetical protein
MKYLIIKDFENVPGEVFAKGDVLELWPDTAERVVNEKAAIPIPDGADPEQFRNSIINKKSK